MNVNDIGYSNLLYAFIFVLIVLLIFQIKKISLKKTFLNATIRMTLQLILVGYILDYVFGSENPFTTFLIIIIIEAFSIINTIKRTKVKDKSLMKIIAISIVPSTLLVIFYFLLVVIKIKPWYNPQYFIPITGMVIGNSMNAISLAVNTYKNGFRDKKDEILSSLMLGGTPKNASKSIAKDAINNSLLPTLNKMFSMGIVILPGMMTGQILSGISPVTAIIYQIIVMLASFSSSALGVVLFTEIAYIAFFNKRAQLKN